MVIRCNSSNSTMIGNHQEQENEKKKDAEKQS